MTERELFEAAMHCSQPRPRQLVQSIQDAAIEGFETGFPQNAMAWFHYLTMHLDVPALPFVSSCGAWFARLLQSPAGTYCT